LRPRSSSAPWIARPTRGALDGAAGAPWGASPAAAAISANTAAIEKVGLAALVSPGAFR
jgi:hypothetical protein